jgi:UDPglucose 6-dehydrogenase
MKITVFGAGYVGLVQSAVLADAGHHVMCLDVDADRVARLRKGVIPIFEPGLDAVVTRNVDQGRLEFSTDARAGVLHGQVQFIAVGTPPGEDGSADLSYVLEVARTIATHMDGYRCVVDKSTVPVGTADQVAAQLTAVLSERGVDYPFDMVSNPEFLKEGDAVNDCRRPDRIILGTNSVRAEHLLRELYAPFNRNHDKIIVMDARSAELTKYAANCMLATKISFMNEMANLAERFGADIESVRRGIGSDPRIGYHFIYPGVGYGGSCFPKDVAALVRSAEAVGFDPKVLKAVEARNREQKGVLFEKIAHHFRGNLRGKTIALWGLAFKPNTDDMREAPSRVLMEALWTSGARVQAYDPEAMSEARHLYGARDDLQLCVSMEAALEGADALAIVTEWQVFRVPDFDLLKAKLKQPVIFDGRNLYEPAAMRDKGFVYFGIGRGA